MPVALVETKFFRPAGRAPGWCRGRGSTSCSGPDATRLTLVSAPAGFGKTTLLAAWLAGRRSETRRPADRVGVARRVRHRRGRLLDLRPDRPRARRARHRRRGAGPARGRPADRGRPGRRAQRAQRPAGRRRPRPRRLPPRREPGDPAGHGVPRRAPAPAGAPGHQHPRRPGAAAGPAAGPRRADRGPRRRPPVHPRRGDRPTSPTPPGSTWTRGDVAALEARTEGWIASLQLAAISLRDRDDPSRFIAGFAGDDRYVVDYLVEEVLDRQPDEVRDFLLGTAILDRLTGPLCDAVTETSGSGQVLESLERRNLFVVPLDDQRRWYRYHHLFADVLRAHLLGEQRRPGRRAAPPRQRLVRRGRRARASPSGTRSPPATSSGPPSWPSSRSRRCGGSAARP